MYLNSLKYSNINSSKLVPKMHKKNSHIKLGFLKPLSKEVELASNN